MADDYSEKKDEYGFQVKEHDEVWARFSSDARAQMLSRGKSMTVNYMFLFGIPKTPKELLLFADQVAVGTLTSAVLDNAVSPTEHGTRAVEEIQPTTASAVRLLDAGGYL
ncbi:MAG: hypothetical protein WC822_05955 [Candidatus Paceibacterota bacterium]